MAPRDPYRNFRFEVENTGFVYAGFQKVSGMKHSINVIEYREGGENEVMRKMPGQSSFEPVTFERGVSNNSDFLDWINQIFNIDNVGGAQGDVEGTWRKDIVVYLKDKSGERVKKYTLLNAWPSEKAVADMDASGNDVMIETLVLQHEGVKEEALV